MAFPEHERQAMRALHGVGDSVIARLEQLGYPSQTRAAIGAVIRLAQQQDGG